MGRPIPIHPFIQQMFAAHLLWTRPGAGCQRETSERTVSSCPQGAVHLEEMGKINKPNICHWVILAVYKKKQSEEGKAGCRAL